MVVRRQGSSLSNPPVYKPAMSVLPDLAPTWLRPEPRKTTTTPGGERLRPGVGWLRAPVIACLLLRSPCAEPRMDLHVRLLTAQNRKNPQWQCNQRLGSMRLRWFSKRTTKQLAWASKVGSEADNTITVRDSRAKRMKSI